MGVFVFLLPMALALLVILYHYVKWKRRPQAVPAGAGDISSPSRRQKLPDWALQVSNLWNNIFPLMVVLGVCLACFWILSRVYIPGAPLDGAVLNKDGEPSNLPVWQYYLLSGGGPVFVASTFLYYYLRWYNQNGGGLFIPVLSQWQVAFLMNHVPLYPLLTPKQRTQFGRRVSLFLQGKDFIGRGGLQVSDPMKLQIAATAVTMGFGFPELRFQHFGRILVYPDEYYSNINNAYHQGEVNPRFGLIILSWNNAKAGLERAEGNNLIVHEMAHALAFENIIENDLWDFIHPRAWQMLHRIADSEMRKFDLGEEGLPFRSYAYTNFHEFFAVACEWFFEVPEKLLAEYPVVYRCMVAVLNQDPVAGEFRLAHIDVELT